MRKGLPDSGQSIIKKYYLSQRHHRFIKTTTISARIQNFHVGSYRDTILKKHKLKTNIPQP